MSFCNGHTDQHARLRLLVEIPAHQAELAFLQTTFDASGRQHTAFNFVLAPFVIQDVARPELSES